MGKIKPSKQFINPDTPKVKTSHQGQTVSNKTEWYEIDGYGRGYWYKDDSDNIINVLNPVIDKFSVTCPVDEEDQDYLRETFMDVFKTDEKLNFKTSNSKGRYRIAVNWFDGPTGQKVRLECDPFKKTDNFFRMEFNPAKLKSDGMGRMSAMLDYIFAGVISYAHVIETGRITRVDIAVDMLNVDFSNLYAFGLEKGKAIHYNSLEFGPETIYLDKPKTKKSQKMVYNKALQLQQAGEADEYNGVLRTRLEYSREGLDAVSLYELGNPFLNFKFSVMNPVYQSDSVPAYVWKFFLDSCRYRGVGVAAELLPEDLKDEFSHLIYQAYEYTWRPDKLWKYWQDYLFRSGVFPDELKQKLTVK